jgi:CheY-like chemotaxis protein/DNA-binding transcriptional regulator YiaG
VEFETKSHNATLFFTEGKLMRDVTRILGTAIRTRRNKLGLSQEELAFRSSLHRTYVADIERGARNPSLESIAKLSKALKLSLSDLFTEIRLPAESARGAQKKEGGSLWLAEHMAEILLVEDDPLDAELAIESLRGCNFTNRIHVARDGAEALDFLFSATADTKRLLALRLLVVFLDLGLPKVGGVEVLQRIRSDPRTKLIPVIVLTGSRLGRDLDECRKLGVKDYIVKPVDFEKFSPAIPRLGLHWALLSQPPKIMPIR